MIDVEEKAAITPTLARELVGSLLEHAQRAAESHGLRATTRGARFDDGSCIVKIEFYRTIAVNDVGDRRVARARMRWAEEYAAFELGKTYLDKEFPAEGQRFVVLGLEVVGETRFVLSREMGAPGMLRLFPTTVVALAFATRAHIEELEAKERRRS